MKLFVVTGMSGAGKSKAVDYLEDLGYYCLDNLPVKLLSSVVGWMESNKDFSRKVAVTLDIRSSDISDSFFSALEAVKRRGVPVRVLFLECEDSVLMKRYKESRRLHPLMNMENQTDISSAIKEERKVLSSVREISDYIVDTTNLATAALREKIVEMVETETDDVEGMLLHFMSFGYKYGIPAEADLVFDVRCLPNPFYEEGLRVLTGLDLPVQEFVFSTTEAEGLFERIREILEFTIPLYEKEGRAQLVVAFGCTGGQHRSTAFANRMQEMFGKKRENVKLTCRDMSVNQHEVKNR
ncbi:MAG: RNase adapter RapZ [Lachnospiraceae bacterium]|nr:RNase adapter RapZ [Lachnospiraceae bacterium]